MNEYQRDICFDASTALIKAVKLLNDAGDELFNVEGGDSLHVFYDTTKCMLNELQQAYYIKSQEELKGD